MLAFTSRACAPPQGPLPLGLMSLLSLSRYKSTPTPAAPSLFNFVQTRRGAPRCHPSSSCSCCPERGHGRLLQCLSVPDLPGACAGKRHGRTYCRDASRDCGIDGGMVAAHLPEHLPGTNPNELLVVSWPGPSTPCLSCVSAFKCAQCVRSLRAPVCAGSLRGWLPRRDVHAPAAVLALRRRVRARQGRQLTVL